MWLTDRQLHPTVHRRRPSFSSRRCSCLEQSASTRDFRTLRGCLPVPSEDPSFSRLLSHLIISTVSDASLNLNAIIVCVALLTYLLAYFTDHPVDVRLLTRRSNTMGGYAANTMQFLAGVISMGNAGVVRWTIAYGSSLFALTTPQ